MPRKKLANGLEMQTVRLPNGKHVQAPVGCDVEALMVDPRARFRFTIEIGAAIVALYRQGHTIATIGGMKGFPKAKIIYDWMEHRSDFRTQMKAARELRGLYFEEKALEAAESARGESSEEVAAQRLKAETYKWASEVNDPATYGRKTAIAVNGPAVFLIDTGIQREQPAIEVSSDPVKKPEPTDVD